MLYEDLFSSFVTSYNEGDVKSAMTSLMRELANILVRSKQDFVDLLNESEIPATIDMTDVSLVNLFIENVTKKPALALGASMLVNMHNKQMDFDGDDEMSDDGVKAGYVTIKTYFFDDYSGANGEEFSYIPGLGQAIAGAVQGVSGLGSKIAEGQQKKKYGAMDLATKKQEAKAAMTQQILAQRQAQIEAATKKREGASKTTKTLLIVGGVVLAIGIIGFVIYKVKKKK